MAVSRYISNRDRCYDTISRLAAAPRKLQINIHTVFAEETLPLCREIIRDLTEDTRVKGKVFALVLLKVKPRGRASGRYHFPSRESLRELSVAAAKCGVKLGVDACGACDFHSMLAENDSLPTEQQEKLPSLKQAEMLFDGCDSFRFSVYINVFGKVFPCSFVEGAPEWGGKKDTKNSSCSTHVTNLDILSCSDFCTDIWKSPAAIKFREQLSHSSDITECWRCSYFKW